MYTPESLDKLAMEINLIDVLKDYISFQTTGQMYKALCPFHSETEPSFLVVHGFRHYHCYGCGAHGDAIAFLMNHKLMGFKEAVDHLAKKYDVKMEEVPRNNNQSIDRHDSSSKPESIFNITEKDVARLNSAFHKMNLSMTKSERIQMNRFVAALYCLADVIRDTSTFPSAKKVGNGKLSENAVLMKKLVSQFPIFSN